MEDAIREGLRSLREEKIYPAAEVRSRNRRMDWAVIYSETVLADLQQITEFIARENARSRRKICESVGRSG